MGNLGIAYRYLGEDQQAIEFYQQVLELRKKIDDRAGEGRALYDIGHVYSDLRQHQRAIELYSQALVIWQEVNHPIF
ncbi:MAG: tetratricopeptide repeat protein [Xenococcaceae cyanobacterium]